MTDRVLLRTNTGKWSYRTNSDDSLFSDILEPLKELEGDKSEVVFSGAPAEILEEDWKYYLTLERWRNYVTLRGDPITLETVDMSHLLTSGEGGNNRLPPIVHLHEIERLARIINLPPNWYLSVAVIGDTSSDRRKGHIIAMGNAVILSDSNSYWNGVSQIDLDNFPFTARILYSMMQDLKEYLPIDEGREESFTSLRAIVYGSIRNALLLSSELSWNVVDWNDVKEMFFDVLGDTISDSKTVSTCDLLSGNGSMRPSLLINIDKNITWRSDKTNQYTYLSLYVDVDHLNELYDRLISSFPEDVDPHDIGLAPILSDTVFDRNVRRPASQISGIASLVTWINFNSLLFPFFERGIRAVSRYDVVGKYCLGGRLSEKDFDPVIDRMMRTTVGMRGLRLIYSSLTNYTGGKNKRVDRFIRVLEYYLDEDSSEDDEESHEESEERPLPSYQV